MRYELNLDTILFEFNWLSILVIDTLLCPFLSVELSSGNCSFNPHLLRQIPTNWTVFKLLNYLAIYEMNHCNQLAGCTDTHAHVHRDSHSHTHMRILSCNRLLSFVKPIGIWVPPSHAHTIYRIAYWMFDEPFPACCWSPPDPGRQHYPFSIPTVCPFPFFLPLLLPALLVSPSLSFCMSMRLLLLLSLLFK